MEQVLARTENSSLLWKTDRAGIFSLSKWAEIAPSWAHLIRINIFPGLEANLGMQRSDFAYLESKLLKIKEKTFEWNEGDRI